MLSLKRHSGGSVNEEIVMVTKDIDITKGKPALFTGGLRGRFIRTMSITIGGVPKDELLKQVRAVRSVSAYADSMMQNEAFTTQSEQETATLIDLCPADFGFAEDPTTDQFLDERRLPEWSAANLDGHVIELCPAEVGPHLAIQYRVQPSGEILWVAMKRIPVSDGRLDVFRVGCDDDGDEIWIDGDWTHSFDRWGLGHHVMFRLRRISTSEV